MHIYGDNYEVFNYYARVLIESMQSSKPMSTYQRISADQAKTLIDDPKSVVLDMRDERSFAAGRIPRAQRISNDNVQEVINQTDSEAHVIVCCYRGNISQSGADFFIRHGFTSFYSLDGGFNGWKLLFPTEVEL